MKLIIKNFVLLFVLCHGSLAFGQSNVFIMVDVSGNPLNDNARITMEMRNSAKDLVEAIITNNYDPAKFKDWGLSGVTADSRIKDIIDKKGQPLLTKDGYILIMPFGDHETYKNFKTTKVENYPSDFYTFFKKYYPSSYNEQNTFMNIAEAYSAFVATESDMAIDQYYLIKVLGKGEDTNSLSYTQSEKAYLDDYNSASSIKKLGKLRYISSGVDFSVEISELNLERILIAKQNKPVSTPPLITPKNVEKKELEIVVPAGKSPEEPYKTDNESLKILWKCMGCTPEISYIVRITELNEGKAIISKTKNKEHTIRLEPGNYKVIVSGDGLISKPKFFTINKGGSSNIFLLLFLLLAAFAALGYFIWKNFGKSEKNYGNGKQINQNRLFTDFDSEKPAGSPSGSPKTGNNIMDDF